MLNQRSSKGGLKYWIISAVLVFPALFPYYTHYFVKTEGRVPTGFIQYDQPYYMASAREHFDHGFRLTYSNPSSRSYDSPAIYFQPQTLFWGVVWYITGWNPGLIYVLTGLIAAVICFRVALSIYAEVVGVEAWPQWLGLVIFCWGGGLLALAGILYNWITNQWQYSIFRFDPFNGWWFLNFGRNLTYPTEALYHALFLGCIFCVIKKRFKFALLLAFVLSSSHPFSGIELLAILTAWAFLEVVLLKNRSVPIYFLLGSAALSIVHVGYYLFFLKLFVEHRSVQSQNEFAWVLRIKNILPAYALVGSLALWSILREHGVKEFFRAPLNRLFVTWFSVAFLLANHELFMRPIQPLHFSRGYIWIPLFLIGVRSLTALFSYLAARKNAVLRMASISILVLVFLSDNALWLASFPGKRWYGFRLTVDEMQLYDWFNAPENKESIVVSEDHKIGYLATVYSPLQAWCSQTLVTPFYAQRGEEIKNLFQNGVFLEEWKKIPLLIVSSNTDKTRAADKNALTASGQQVSTTFHNSSFTVFRVSPQSVLQYAR